jgi:LysR family transcriptional regulator, nitrogen assimilation regulatory protein
MNLKQLEAFVRVAEFGSFSKAAMVLRVAQPALSRQVRALETELRETLLLRNGRGVQLTEAGRRLFEHSVGILELVARAREDIEAQRGQPGGRVVIGLPPSISRQLTVPLIESFNRQLPRARLAIVEGLSAHLAEWLASGRVDIGLMHNPQPQAAIETTPILDEDLCLVAPIISGRRARRLLTSVRTADLAKYRLIVPERSHVIRNLLETQAASSGIKLDIAWEVSSIPSIIDLVCAGYGHAVLTASAVVASGRAAELQAHPLIDPRLKSTLCLAVSANKRASTLTKHALRLLPELVLKVSSKTG